MAAEFLSQQPAEELWRAAVSRAYYAAFHHLRTVAEESVGLPRFGTADDHQDVEQAIRLLDPAIARQFAALRRARNDADYDIESTIRQAEAQASLERSRELLAFR